MVRSISKVLTMVAATVAMAFSAPADNRTQLSPGWNLFSASQEVEIGRQVSQEAEAKVTILNDREAEAYLNELGNRLVAHAPSRHDFPFQFKIVDDDAINAFALPGGFIYINRGVIRAADNEAELAGVIAHEIGHVVLRHGKNQLSRAYVAQVPSAIVGGVVGSGSVGSILAQLGVGFATNSVLLKYSRDAEREADLMATQVLFDSGYNPQAMANFFEKIQAESSGRAAEFFSSHPNPENRSGSVQKEIQKLGGAPPEMRNDSADFQAIRSRLTRKPGPVSGQDKPALASLETKSAVVLSH